jgi:tetratricopeptide (TPR) repeat protein
VFLSALGRVWAAELPDQLLAERTAGTDDPDGWLPAVAEASSADAAELVSAADAALVASAAQVLLARARSLLMAGNNADWTAVRRLGELLLRVVERGHGTDFPNGELAMAHARMLIGMGLHLVSPMMAGRSYRQAARDYASRHAPRPAAAARLAAATTDWSPLLGEDQGGVREHLAALAAVDSAGALEVEPELDGYLRTLTTIGALRAEAGSAVPSWRDPETAALLRLAADASLNDSVEVSARLARAADVVYAAAGLEPEALAGLGVSLILRRRWHDALPLLEELHRRDPADPDGALRLARVYYELARWEDVKALLVPLLSDLADPQDVAVLAFLEGAAVMSGDPQAERWTALLAQIDPQRTLRAQLPRQPGPASPPPPEPLRAVLREGTLTVASDLMELPEADRAAHLTAAVIAGTPDGGKLLADVAEDNPELARRVMQLLGIRETTVEEAQFKRHIAAGEAHFRNGRFAEAERDYRSAADIDPDDLTGWLYIGDTWYRRGSYALAQAYFEESIAVQPSPQAFRFLGDAITMSGGSRTWARLCYEEALRLDPSYGGAKVALLQVTESGSDDGHAEAAGSELTPRAPGNDHPGAPRWLTAARWRFGPTHETEQSQHSPTGPVEAVAPHLPVAGPPEGIASGPRKAALPGPGAATAARVGDRLLRATIERFGPGSVLTVLDDDDAFGRWVAGAKAEQIATSIMILVSIAFQYEAKDRDVERWAHLERRRVQLAEALPPDFGPEQAPMGLGRDRLLGDAYKGRASVLQAEGRLAESRAWYLRALGLLEAEQAARARVGLTGEPEFDRIFLSSDPLASLLRDLARICGEVGDHDSAARYWQRAERLDAARPTTAGWIEDCIGKGREAFAQGRTDLALSAFHEAFERAEEDLHTQVTPRALAHTFNALGQCHRLLGLYRSAFAYLDGARRLNETTGNAVRLAYDFRELGRLYRARPDLGDAEEAFEWSMLNASVPAAASDELCWTSKDGGIHRVTAADRAWDSLLELADLKEQRDDLPGAADLLTLASRLGDVVRAAVADDAERVAVAGNRAQASTALTRIQLRRALAAGPDTHQAASEAWLASEAMRALSFLDALGDDPLAVPAGLRQALVAEETAAIEERRRLLEIGGDGVAFWDRLRGLQTRLEDIWATMLAETPAAAEYVEVRRSRPATAADIHARLAADGRPTVLASLNPLGPDALAVIAVRSDDPHLRVASRAVDRPRLDRFIVENFGSAGRVRELAIDLEDLWHHETRAIGDTLAEVADPGDMLVVCPFGPLHYVPFAALAVQGVPLIERNPVAVLPNGSIIRALRTAAGTSACVPAAVLGDPTEDLAGARAEADMVGGLLGADPLVGQQATRAVVTEALARARIVHIAAHARFDADDPMSSGIRLADGLLTARTLLAMSAPSLSLVTLSACETGISQIDPAQELLGLTRALMFAGADSLLLSLWKVPDASTVDIMSTFYNRLENGAWKADALRAAALGARERYGAHRFDQWAGFQLIGEWR